MGVNILEIFCEPNFEGHILDINPMIGMILSPPLPKRKAGVGDQLILGPLFLECLSTLNEKKNLGKRTWKNF
jgi:hypothetical protein